MLIVNILHKISSLLLNPAIFGAQNLNNCWVCFSTSHDQFIIVNRLPDGTFIQSCASWSLKSEKLPIKILGLYPFTGSPYVSQNAWNTNHIHYVQCSTEFFCMKSQWRSTRPKFSPSSFQTFGINLR